MDRPNEDSTDTFRFPRAFKVLSWVVLVTFLGLAVFGAWSVRAMPDEKVVWWICALVFATVALLQITTVRRLGEKIHIDSRAVTYEAPDGDRVSLPWDQVARVVDRPMLQRMELHGRNGSTIIRIENQLERFDRLREVVLQRTNWESREDAHQLPATFFRTTPYFVVMAGLPVIFLGLTVAAVAGRVSGIWASLVVPASIPAWHCYNDWLYIGVDRSGITLHHLLSGRVIAIDQIADVRLETLGKAYGNMGVAVSIELRNGKTERLAAVRGGSLPLYRTLLAVVRSKPWPDELSG